MSREQCPVCSASDLEELIALEDYPFAGNGAVQPEKASEVPHGILSIGICHVCGAIFQYEPVSFEDLDGMLLRQPPPLDPSDTKMEIAETERFLESLRRYGPKSGHILDVGCGTGYLMDRLGKVGYKVTGVDAHHLAVEQAKEKGFDITEGRFEEGMFEDEMFDVIIARSVLEHVIEPSTILSTMVNVLKPGGILAIEVPNHDRVFSRSTFGGFSFHHVCYWSAPTLRYSLTLQGLDVFGGHEESYIAMFGRKPDKGEPGTDPVPPSDLFVDTTMEEVDKFLERKDNFADELPGFVNDRFPDGIVVLGAGAPTVDMLYYTGLDEEVKNIVTTDKTRHGAMLANTPFTIEPLEKALKDKAGGIVVCSERRQEELIHRLDDFRNDGGSVIRITPKIEII